MAEWFTLIAGEQAGPISTDVLRKLVQYNKMGDGDFAWKEGETKKISAARLKELLKFFYETESGEVIGPVFGAELRDAALNGLIKPSTRLKENDSDWVSAKSVPGLFSREGTPLRLPLATRISDDPDFTPIEDSPRSSDRRSSSNTSNFSAVDDESFVEEFGFSPAEELGEQPEGRDSWYYIDPGVLNDEQLGPVKTVDILQLISTGDLTSDDAIAGPQTNNEWVTLSSIEIFKPELRQQLRTQDGARELESLQKAHDKLILKEARQKRQLKNEQDRQQRREENRMHAAARQSRRAHFTASTFSYLEKLIDWKFERYLTPWIIRWTWVSALILILVWTVKLCFIACLLLVGNGIFHDDTVGDDSPVGDDSSVVAESYPMPSTEQVAYVLIAATVVIIVFLAILWLRVLLEMCIVAFNIANTLTSIDDKLD